jgi:CheY-like chemotaxis protein
MGQASILLVEDEALIQLMLADMIEELGHRVIATAASVDAGRHLAETGEYDLAILDINLDGFSVAPVADVVVDRGRPLFFLTGYGVAGVPDRFRDKPVLNKPCTQEVLKRTIDFVLKN